MERIEAKIFTAARTKKAQREWFERNGFRYAVDTKGDVYTTDDWMNLRDKGHAALNDGDGFDVGFLDA